MKAETTNIDRFNLTALALFEKLHGAFPVPIKIDPIEVGAGAAPPDASTEVGWSFSAEASSVVIWLAAEGFVSYSTCQGGDFYDVCLTLKGLTVLNSVPASLGTETVIGRIKGILSTGAERAGTAAITNIVGEIFKLAAR